MDDPRFPAWTRRRFGATAGVLTASLAALASVAPGRAKKRNRKRKRKPKKPKLQTAYECPGPHEFVLGDGGTDRVAQVFTAGRSGTLRQIRFAIDKPAGFSGDYLVQLVRLLGSGLPSPSPLDVMAAVTIPDAGVPLGESTLVATFAGPALVAGTGYAAILSRPGTGLGGLQARIYQGGSDCEGTIAVAVGAGAFDDQLGDVVVAVVVD